MTDEVICILEDDESARSPPLTAIRRDAETIVIGDFASTPPSTTKRKYDNAIELLDSPDELIPKNESNRFETPPRNNAYKRRAKPITPSSTIQSSMNATMVFDIVTALNTKDPGVAIAALRSIVVLGKEYPSDLLYDELIDRILSVDAIEYVDAVSIYSSLVFVLDRAAECSCDLTFPHQWDPFANALQDLSVKSIDETWRRTLLVAQFYIYALKTDFELCRARYPSSNMVERTRLFGLLYQQDVLDSSRKKANKIKVDNKLILQAVGFGLQLWARVYGEEEKTREEQEILQKSMLEADDMCIAMVRLIEMLYMCTDQIHNILQRIHAGLLDLPRDVRIRFSHVLQYSELKVQLSTMVIGHTHKARSKENEWYECNAIGRMLQGKQATSSELYSQSHLKHFMESVPKDDCTRLLHEIILAQETKKNKEGEKD